MEASSKFSGENVGRKDSKSAKNCAEAGHKTEGKKRGKKKRRAVGKRVSKKETATRTGTGDDVEKFVSKAKAQAQAAQAVRRTVLDIQLFLLEGAQSMAQLHGACPLLTQSEYADVVTERSIAKHCGYPLCRQDLIPENERKGRYRISLREHKVYDIRETNRFCSSKCLVASKTFQSTLQIHREGMFGRERLSAVKRNVFDSPSSATDAVDQNERVATDDPLVLGIQEREHCNLLNLEDADRLDDIEGYVPGISVRQRCSEEIGASCGVSSENQVEVAADVNEPAHGDEGDAAAFPRRSSASEDKSKSLSILDEPEVEGDPTTYLRSALKKANSERILRRNVSWKDQREREQEPGKAGPESSLRPSDTPSIHAEANEQTVAPRAADSLRSQNTPISGSSEPGSCNVDPTGTAEAVGRTRDHSEVSIAETSDRVLAAETIASALMDAAEAAAGGNVESAEAVVRAGLSIVSVTEQEKGWSPLEHPNEDMQNETDEKPASGTPPDGEIDRRWPKLEEPKLEADGDDVCFETGRGGWYDAAPRNFKVEVSVFGTKWMALEEWISAKTLAYIYGKLPEDEEKFVIANGKEYNRLAPVEGGASAQISQTFAACVSQAFPEVVRALRLGVPVSVMEQHIARLVETMTFKSPLPPFGPKQWSMILALLVDCLSVHRLPLIGAHLTNNMALLRKFLDSTGTSEAEYDAFRGLLLPLGRLPTFSTMSGG